MHKWDHYHYPLTITTKDSSYAVRYFITYLSAAGLGLTGFFTPYTNPGSYFCGGAAPTVKVNIRIIFKYLKYNLYWSKLFNVQ